MIQRVLYGKGKEKECTVEKPDRQDLSQLVKVNTNSDMSW